MKLFFHKMIVLLAAVMSLAVHCHPPVPPDPPTPPDIVDPTIIIDTSYDFSAEGGTVTLSMTMTEAWSTDVEGGDGWCFLNKKSGQAGEATVTITVNKNDTYNARSCTVTMSSKNSIGKIIINQAQLDVLAVDPEYYAFPAEGGEFSPEITANIEYEVTLSAGWIAWNEGTITVEENTEAEQRSATVSFVGDGLSAQITIDQEGIAPPDPHDELDGIVTVIQTHTEGVGIPVVFMGDAFSHDQVEDGTYDDLMQKASQALFSIEPYATFRNMFDIYTVSVVSEYYEDFEIAGSTALGTYFGNGAYVNGDHVKCREYALKAVPENIIDDVLVVILMNREVHAGRCYMQQINTIGDEDPDALDDCSHGIALAYLALGADEADFTGLVRHEAGGHGFGRLADEYYYEGTGVIPRYVVDNYKSLQTLTHAYMNVDFTGNPEEVLWKGFLQDERYQAEGLGVFEGACTYEAGAWRPSPTSIMVDNEGCFNAPSREAIYYRIHKLAYGREWEYDFEAFAEYDAINRAIAPEEEPHASPARQKSIRRAERCLPPEILE
jgi:hypothetical protein